MEQSIDDSNLLLHCASCRVRYATNEEEELNILEVIQDGQMSLLM